MHHLSFHYHNTNNSTNAGKKKGEMKETNKTEAQYDYICNGEVIYIKQKFPVYLYVRISLCWPAGFTAKVWENRVIRSMYVFKYWNQT